jgi:hypothetical protein
MEIDGKVTTHHHTIAGEFNNYYISVAEIPTILYISLMAI